MVADASSNTGSYPKILAAQTRLDKIKTASKVQIHLNPKDYESLDTLKTALDIIWSKFGSSYQINFSKN